MNSLITNPGLSHLSDNIFENLDNLSLCKCLQVCSIWYDYLHRNILYHRRRLEKQKQYHADKKWMQTHTEWKILVEKILKSHDIGSIEIMTTSLNRMKPFVNNPNSQQMFTWPSTKPKNPVTHSQTTPLHLAAKFGHVDIMNFLLDFVENLDIQDVDGWTPLHLAVKARQHHIVEILTEKMASSNQRDKQGLTPFHYALEIEDMRMIKQLLPQQLHSSTFTLESGKPTTPSHFAIEKGNIELLEIIIEHFGDTGLSIINDGWTLIHTAARFGRLEMLKFLEKKYKTGFNVKAKNGMTPLHLAVIGGRRQTVKYLVSESPELVDVLDCKEKSPMDYAMGRGNTTIVKILEFDQ